MNDYDQAARYGVKFGPQAHASWLFPGACRAMRFARWRDSQAAPRPGEPDRRCDTVMELVHRKGLSQPRLAVIELFTGPDAEALDRLGEYLWRFRRDLRHGPDRRDKYPPPHGAMIFLTGLCGEKSARADLPDEDEVENALVPRVVEMQEENGLVLLDRIAQNPVDAPRLPWLPLMRHGQKPSTAQSWARLCRGTLSVADAPDAAGLAWVFCELTDCRPAWRPYLESFTMNESPFLRDVRSATRVEMQREWLLDYLRSRLDGDHLTAAVALVERQRDPEVLSRWFKSILRLPPEAILPKLVE